MKLGVVITMYDEYDIVLSSVKNILSHFPDSKIVIVQSEHTGDNTLLKSLVHKFIILPDLSVSFHRMELPSQAICRNISRGCSELLKESLDLIVIFTGDTLITDSNNILRRYNDMENNQWMGMVSQAIGQKFHAETDNPPQGIVEGRYQYPNITDFACCFFLIKSKILQEVHAFCDIKITNRWTSEQCLGDEMVRTIGGNQDVFHQKVGILNKNSGAYAYNDGIEYHAKTGRPSR